MTSTSVDRALYRTRAFERDWVEPLWREAEESAHLAGEGASLQLCIRLLQEAHGWVFLGSRVGYFTAGYELPDRDIVIGRGIFASPPVELRADFMDAETFAVAISEALEDLTPERREFLRLFCFTHDGEWDARLTEAAQLARALAARSELSLPPDRLERIAWSFGAESGELPPPTAASAHGHTRLPSIWRSRVGIVHSSHLASRKRWADLQRVRRAIAAVVDPLRVGEAMPEAAPAAALAEADAAEAADAARAAEAADAARAMESETDFE